MMRFRMILTIAIAAIGGAQRPVQIVVFKTGIFLRKFNDHAFLSLIGKDLEF